MSNKTLYRLSDSAAAEPLVNKWAAWSHIIAPVACSLHLQNYQLKLLSSYLDDPKAHVKACKNPQLRSGCFVDIAQERVDEVRALLADTEAAQADNLALAGSLIDFQNYLVREARGHSLEPYYKKLPSKLRGYAELIYDYYNRPSIRLIESLLYESNYYKKNLQSLRLFRQESDNSRPFFMNTPRLPEPDQIDWAVAFDDPLVDEFFELDFSPKPLEYIRELVGLDANNDHLLRPLLSEGRIPQRERWSGPGSRITYLGHASVLIEWGKISILTDPCIAITPSHGGPDRLTYKDLPDKIDYVLVTHNHHDHFCMESLLRLRHRIQCLVVPRSYGIFYGDLSLKLLARKVGFKHVIEVDTLESIELPDGSITAIPFMGEHADLPHGKTAYAIRAGKHQIMIGADSDCLDDRIYQHIREVLGPIDTVFLGMECVGAPLSWSCGSFLPQRYESSIEQSRRYKGCDAARALSILEAVDAQRIYIYAMGLEPWLEYLLGLAYAQDAPQIKEAHKLLTIAQERRYIDARLLFGKAEIYLTDSPEEHKSHSLHFAAGRHQQQAQVATERSPGLQPADNSEDQFIFD